jgi:hypothetical protein
MLKYSNHATAGERLSTDAILDVFVTGKPAERKEPPPKKPPIKSPKKPNKPIGDPPSKKPAKRVAAFL